MNLCLNSNAFNPIPLNVPHLSSEPLMLPTGIDANIYATTKKIKAENLAYVPTIINPQFHPTLPIKPLYRSLQVPIKLVHVPRNLNHNQTPLKDKKLVVKGHCFNLKGFSNKSTNNITVLDGKSENAEAKNKNLIQDCAEENSKEISNSPISEALSTPKNIEFDIPKLNPNYEKTYQNKMSLSVNKIATRPLGLAEIEKQMTHFRQTMQAQNIPSMGLNQPLRAQVRPQMLLHGQPRPIIRKPLHKAVPIYPAGTMLAGIEKQHMLSPLKEMRPIDFLQKNQLPLPLDKLDNSCSSPDSDLNSLVDASLSYFLLNDPLERKIAYLEEQAMKAYYGRIAQQTANEKSFALF